MVNASRFSHKILYQSGLKFNLYHFLCRYAQKIFFASTVEYNLCECWVFLLGFDCLDPGSIAYFHILSWEKFEPSAIE